MASIKITDTLSMSINAHFEHVQVTTLDTKTGMCSTMYVNTATSEQIAKALFAANEEISRGKY